jgi:hypothetical protein
VLTRFGRSLRRSLGRTVLMLAFAILSGAPLPARAQWWSWMEGGEGTSPVTRKAAKEYATILGLDKDQKEAVQTLVDGFVSAHKATMKQMQKSSQVLQEKYQESQDWSAYGKEVGKIMKEGIEKAEGLENGFLDDLKVVLTDEQSGRWPKLERYRRRQELLKFGMVSGQAVDLIEVARTLDLKTESIAGMAEELDNYEMEMDRQLQDGRKISKEMQDTMMNGWSGDNQKQMQEMMTRVMDMARAVRDVNLKHARQMAALLSEDTVPKFDFEIRKRSYPRVYGKSHVLKVLTVASGFNDLEQAQKDQLAAIKTAYERDVAPMNDKWAKAIEEEESKNSDPFAAMYGWMGRDNDSPVGKARKERRDLDAKTQERIAALLKDDQKTRLPDKEPDDNARWVRVTDDDEADK